MPRRFVPFGSHWAMGIAVPYSLGVIDGGQFWSCGQCPLDLRAAVQSPGDLIAQLRITAELIREQFAPHGITASSIAKLVAYVAGDKAELAASERFLRDALAPVPLVIAVGVPPFYYPGMRVEVDVYGAEQTAAAIAPGAVRSGDLVHVACPLADVAAAMSGAALSPDHLVTARIYGANGGTAQLLPFPFDHGSVARALGSGTMADLVFAPSPMPGAQAVSTESAEGVILTRRVAGRYACFLGRMPQPEQSLATAARRIMETFKQHLAREGLGFADVVKQQTHYVGGPNADDLYANMQVRNGYYHTSGPASTGLAVPGFVDPDTRITIEIIACRT